MDYDFTPPESTPITFYLSPAVAAMLMREVTGCGLLEAKTFLERNLTNKDYIGYEVRDVGKLIKAYLSHKNDD